MGYTPTEVINKHRNNSFLLGEHVLEKLSLSPFSFGWAYIFVISVTGLGLANMFTSKSIWIEE